MPCHPVNNYCFGSSEDEKSNNAEEMSALNVDIETSETKIYNRPVELMNSKNIKLFNICQKILQNGNKHKLFHMVEKPPVYLKGVEVPKKMKMNLLNS